MVFIWSMHSIPNNTISFQPTNQPTKMSSFINQDTGYESDAEIDHKIHLRNIESLTAFYEDEVALNLTAEEKALRDAEYGITDAEYEFWLMFEIRGYEDGTKGTTEVKRMMTATPTAVEERVYEDDADEYEIDMDDLLQDKIEDYAASWLSDNDDDDEY